MIENKLVAVRPDSEYLKEWNKSEAMWCPFSELTMDGWSCIGISSSTDGDLGLFVRTVPDAPKSPWVTDGVTLPRAGTTDVLVSDGGKSHEWDYHEFAEAFSPRGLGAEYYFKVDQIDGWMYMPAPVAPAEG